jgi:uncharacterized membrane protein YhaH (DUF805 family)
MKAAIINGYKRWNDYSGRTSRSQFWWFFLFTYITPLITGLVSLLFSLLFLSLGLSELSSFSVIFFFLYIINVPIFLAVAVRRMHDVGKSGWFILVPFYNLYLYVQPAVEKGRIPNWILAEKISLGFVGILVVSSLIGLFGGETGSIGGLIFWTIIYFLIRKRNQSNKKIDGQQ